MSSLRALFIFSVSHFLCAFYCSTVFALIVYCPYIPFLLLTDHENLGSKTPRILRRTLPHFLAISVGLDIARAVGWHLLTLHRGADQQAKFKKSPFEILRDHHCPVPMGLLSALIEHNRRHLDLVPDLESGKTTPSAGGFRLFYHYFYILFSTAPLQPYPIVLTVCALACGVVFTGVFRYHFPDLERGWLVSCGSWVIMGLGQEAVLWRSAARDSHIDSSPFQKGGDLVRWCTDNALVVIQFLRAHSAPMQARDAACSKQSQRWKESKETA